MKSRVRCAYYLVVAAFPPDPDEDSATPSPSRHNLPEACPLHNPLTRGNATCINGILHAIAIFGWSELEWTPERGKVVDMGIAKECKVALVTGAADGLGAGAASRLVREGWMVLLFDRNPKVVETAERITNEHQTSTGSVLTFVGNVASEQDVSTAFSTLDGQFHRIDLVVANAGVSGEGTDLCDVDLDDFDQVLAVNLRGVFLTCRAAAREMRKARSGSIITTSSIFGIEPVPGAAAYCASKAAVIALTKTMARELAPYGVRVNSIAPGYMHTEMQWKAIQQKAAQSGRSFEDERRLIVDFIPMGRHGTPDDFGAAVAFLASEDAAYITGHTLGITGGVVNW